MERGFKELPWFPPANYIYNDSHHNVTIEYNLNMFQRVFVMMEQHNSSISAMIIASVVTTCIILGCVCFIMAEEPEWLDHHTVECASEVDVVCDDSRTLSYLGCPIPHHRRRLGGGADPTCVKYEGDDGDDDHRRLAGSTKCEEFMNPTCDTDYPDGKTVPQGYNTSYNNGDTYYNATLNYCACVVDPDSQYCPFTQICKPHHDLILEAIESACMFIFTLEYIVLLITVPFAPSRLAHTMPHEFDDEHHFHKPDPVYPVWYQMLKFFTSWKMLIDLATLLPFYILIDTNPVFGGKAAGGGTFNFIRVFRLLRILHIFKISRKNQILALVERTMKLSMPTIALTIYITAIHMVFWGSLVHFFEQGEWRSGSTYEAFSENPDGTYMRLNHLSNEWEPSPFNSIAIGIYWVIMMSTTTGVGNQLQPTTAGGRACAAFVACIGVILMAIPIGVVGLNFAQEWEKMKLKFLTTHELGPVLHVKMTTERVVHVHASDHEDGQEMEVKEKSENVKMSEEMTEINDQLVESLSSVIEGQKSLAVTHERIGDFMNRLTKKIAEQQESASAKNV